MPRTGKPKGHLTCTICRDWFPKRVMQKAENGKFYCPEDLKNRQAREQKKKEEERKVIVVGSEVDPEEHPNPECFICGLTRDCIKSFDDGRVYCPKHIPVPEREKWKFGGSKELDDFLNEAADILQIPASAIRAGMQQAKKRKAETAEQELPKKQKTDPFSNPHLEDEKDKKIEALTAKLKKCEDYMEDLKSDVLDYTCLSCHEDPRTVVVEPCMHLVTCLDCHDPERKTCILCYQDISARYVISTFEPEAK